MERPEYILCITEGECLEKDILALIDEYLLKSKKPLKIISYKTDIYNLYRAIKNDGIATFDLIKETIQEQFYKKSDSSEIKKEYENISKIKRHHIAETFLFFDYDGHIKNHKLNNLDEVVRELLSFFNKKDADRGKLYISYPMAEAFKDKCFEDNKPKTTPISLGSNYKSNVNATYSGKHFNQKEITEQCLHSIFSYHLKCANFLSTGSFELPIKIDDYRKVAEQIGIFKQQKTKYIDTNKSVLVLSGFPLFVVEYFNEKKLSELIDCLQQNKQNTLINKICLPV